MPKFGLSDSKKEAVELEVVEALKTQNYSPNTINNYGENLLHVSVAHGCSSIATEILVKEEFKCAIDRKNKFGWSPLMLAVRNRDAETVKLLLTENASVNESNYLGMSILGLAAAIGREMFEIVYEACPSALLDAFTEDITPLCVAAMRNDKDLFLRLVDLGFQPLKGNEYTQIMMRQSSVPEISSSAIQYPEIDDYWNDVTDNIDVEPYCQEENDDKEELDKIRENIPSITVTKPIFTFDCVPPVKKTIAKNIEMNLMLNKNIPIEQSLISPNLSCDIEKNFPVSPNVCLMDKSYKDLAHRPQANIPPDLEIISDPDDPNSTLGYSPEFSPLKSPHVPQEINENVFGESTPTPPRYKTPPKGMMVSSEEMKMVVLLKHFKLSHLIAIFLKQEVDLELFLTLSEADLLEIGVTNKTDREQVLAVVADCKRMKL